jgi:prepilin-type N-terminal cleavage/methylation domain-containing protein
LEKNSIKFKAFTLAEVLITLGIIGVIAAMTIPALINQSQKVETVSKLKKTYSVLSSVLTSSMMDNGDTTTWAWSGATAMVKTYIVPYMSIAKDCGWTTVPSDCVSAKKTWLNKHNSSYFVDGYQFILKDGTQYLIHLDEDDKLYFQFDIDLNGDKSPNMFGKDCFSLRIFNDSPHKNKIFFIDPGENRNSLKTQSQWGCNRTASIAPGLYCGALIQIDGWQIKDDYPW